MFTPQQIDQVSFGRSTFGGYDMQQVDEFLEPLTEDYVTLYKENALLKSKMRVLVGKLEEYRKNEASMKDAVINAQKTCDKMVAEAQAKCAQMLNNASAISADVYLYAASKVDTSAFSSSAVKVNGKAVSNNDYVKVGETLVTTLDDSEGTGVIATTTSETAVAGKSVADGYKVGNEDVTLNAAWKITLNGIDSIKVVTTGETVTDGDYVVDSKELDYDTAKGANHILDTTSGVIYGSTAVSSDVTVDKNIELSAATKVVLTDNKIATAGYRTGTDRYQEIGAPSGSDVTAYVVPGTVIEVTGKTTTTGTVIDIQVSSGTAPEKTVDEAASTTLGAYAEFRLGDVDVTLTEK